MKRIPLLLTLAAILLGPLPLRAGEEADLYYQKGMDAYLQGNYDQAILNTAKAVQVEPTYQKAQDLLSVLILEKEKGSKTEIWLSQKTPVTESETAAATAPVTVEAAGLAEIRTQIAELRDQVKALGGKSRYAELERRIQAMAGLLMRSSNGQFEELKNRHEQLLGKLEKLGLDQKGMGFSLFWLFVLVGLSLLLSLWALLRRPAAPSRAASPGSLGPPPPTP